MVISLKNLSYQQCIIQLKLPTLKYRRLRGDVVEVFKILNKMFDTSVVPNLHLDKSSVTRGNKFKLIKDSSHDVRNYYFTARITLIWNSLPNWEVDVDNINTFKARLDKFWSNQEVLYDFTADITRTRYRLQCDIDDFMYLFLAKLVT